MTITIELEPEDDARMRSQAESRGLSPDEFVRHLISRALSEEPWGDDVAEWDALARDIGRSWPEGVSATEELAEMRR